jgi:Glycosyltransferase family 87
VTSRTAFLAIVAAALALLVGLFVANLEGGPGIKDTPVYQSYGDRIENGKVPYRDFRVEYPPLALAPFTLSSLLSSTESGYESVFQALMIFAFAGCSVLIVLSLDALGASTVRVAASVGAFWAGIALLGPFLMTRFDLFAALMTLAAMTAILHRRENLGPILLGLAVATKIYPAVLLPLLVIRAARRGSGPLRPLLLTLATAALVYLPFAIVSPDGVVRSIWRQAGRPLQIESIGSGVLLALHNAFGMPLGWASGAGSQNLTGTVASVASGVTTLALIVVLPLLWIRYARGNLASNERFARYGAASIVAFVALGKVLSPQFLVWVVAAVVLVQGTRGTVATALVLIACALTRLWFPRSYWELVKQFDPTASWLVLLRDLVLLAVLAVLVARPVRAAVRAREPEPA